MKIRQFLSKILPASWMPYLLHLRPRSWAIVTAHMTVGFLLANGLHLAQDTIQRCVVAAISWAVLGNGGTLAINSVFDKDEGDIGYLESPPPPPHDTPHHLVPGPPGSDHSHPRPLPPRPSTLQPSLA